MKIVVDDIPEGGLSVDLTEQGEVLAELAAGTDAHEGHGGELEFTFLGPVTSHMDFTATSGNVYVRGTMKAALQFECSRCLNGFEMDLDTDFSIFFVRGREEAKELELSAADMEVNYLEGPEIDTTELLLAQIALETPMQPLCREDCKGLCPSCGADLNAGDCGCSRTEKIDPRFAALKNFKER